MIRTIKYILCTLALMPIVAYAMPSTQAQDQKQLEKDLKQLRGDSAKMAKEITNLQRSIERKQADLDKLKSDYAKTPEGKQIAELHSTIVALTGDLDALNATIARQQDSIANKTASAQITQRINAINATDTGLREYAEAIRSRLTAQVDSTRRLLYSQMDTAAMRKLMDELLLYRDDQRLQIPQSKLQKLIALKADYDGCRAAVTQLYDPKTVRRAVRKLHDMESYICTSTPEDAQPWTDDQWAEMEQLIAVINSYGSAVDALKELITQVRKMREPYVPTSASIIEDKVERLINDFDNTNLEKINRIPYLAEKYASYRAGVLKNAFNCDDIADEILSCPVNNK